MPDPVTGVIAGSSVLGGAISSRGASKAADAQRSADAQRLAFEREMYQEQKAAQQPFLDIGLKNLNELAALYGEGGAYSMAPTLNELQMDPGYGFRFGEGMKALERSAAARGGLLSGSMLKGAQRYGQELGSQEYQNAFARAMEQRRAVTNVRSGLGGIGPVAAGEIGTGARSLAAGGGQAISNMGQARASGYIGQANALSNALGQAAMGYGLSQGGYFGGGGRSNALGVVPPSYMRGYNV